MLEEKTKERITDDRCREEMVSDSSRGETIHLDGRLQDDAVILVNRVSQLEKQVQQLQMQQLEAEKRNLEEQLERERRKVDDVMKERDEAEKRNLEEQLERERRKVDDVMKERDESEKRNLEEQLERERRKVDDVMKERDEAEKRNLEEQLERERRKVDVMKERDEAEKRNLEEQLERERRKVVDVMKERDEALSARDAAVMRLDDVLVRAKPRKVGFANYRDLEKLSSDDRRRLKTRLDLFARSVLEMADEHQWGRRIPSGLTSLLGDFCVGYEDSLRNVSVKLQHVHSIRSEGKMLRDSDEEAALLLIMNNRCYWSNQHQNCLLVVEALITLRAVRLWLS
jgi:chromosome segregation ATPase